MRSLFHTRSAPQCTRAGSRYSAKLKWKLALSQPWFDLPNFSKGLRSIMGYLSAPKMAPPERGSSFGLVTVLARLCCGEGGKPGLSRWCQMQRTSRPAAQMALFKQASQDSRRQASGEMMAPFRPVETETEVGPGCAFAFDGEALLGSPLLARRCDLHGIAPDADVATPLQKIAQLDT